MATGKGKSYNLCDLVFLDFPDIAKVNGYKENEGGLLNRLDNETGGLVMFAKSNDSFVYYKRVMQEEKILKIYTAVVSGKVEQAEGEINFSIAHHKKQKRKMVISNFKPFRSNEKKALTKYKVIKKCEKQTVLELYITKGRRHQIRTHLACIGHPIVGDKLYNKEKRPEIQNHLLFASGLIFVPFHKKEEQKIFTKVPFI